MKSRTRTWIWILFYCLRHLMREKNTEDVKSKDQPSSSRDAELLFMAQKIKAFEEERDCLRQTVKTLSDKRVSREEVCLEDKGPESTDDTSSSSSTSSSSEDGHPQKRKHGKKKKEKLLSREKQLQGQSGTRVRTPEVVLKRYKMTLKAFKEEGSMNRAFKKVGVDRNTLALTAVVAELQMVDPDFSKSVPKFSPSEKLIDFSRRCQEVLTADVRSAINAKKSAGLLLPISYKLK